MCPFSATPGECFWVSIPGKASHPAIVIGSADGEALYVHVSDADHNLDPTVTLKPGDLACITKPSQIIFSRAQTAAANILISDVKERQAYVDGIASEDLLVKIRDGLLASPRSSGYYQKWIRRNYPR